MTAGLEVIGHMPIAPAVLQHRFVREAIANAMVREEAGVREQVVGTANTKRCELYGWAPNVDSHADKTGWVYLVTLDDNFTTLCAGVDDTLDEVLMVEMRQGTVVRLNDHLEHWTSDERSHRIAAFVGSFSEPQDDVAMQALRDGLAALERGDYYGAPRVRDGFRALMPDECLIPNAAFDALEPALLADARRARKLIERCGKCHRVAVKGDKAWPYFSELSRCRAHLGSGS